MDATIQKIVSDENHRVKKKKDETIRIIKIVRSQ